MSGSNERRVAEARAWLAEQGPAMEEKLAELVRQNSYTGNVEGGNRTASLLRELFTVPGLSCEPTPSQRFADHLVFRTRREGPSLALVGHLDTVFPPGSFEGYRRDGALARGPGVLDMKGGLVVTGTALLALAQVGALEDLALRWIVVSDEEVGSPEGQGVIAAAAAGASAGLVFEAGRAGDAV